MATKYKIRLQIVATADDDGSDAASVTAAQITSRLTTVNKVFTPANIEFVFDESDDFLKINSSLLNREFTILEPPNVGSDKWDHEPQVDGESHTQARVDIAKQFSGKLVIIFRNRKKLVQEEDTGHWKVANRGGGSSSSNSLFVNMSTSSGANDLAHEIGHYLQCPHPFVSGVATVADAAAKIKKFVDNGGAKADGLHALDGDRNWVLDTPADCKGSIFESEGLEPCGADGNITIPVNFGGGETKNYTLAPDRSLVMSYFKGCPGDKTISPQQARRVRDGLEFRLRHDLISIKPSFSYNIVRGATGNAGAVNEVDVAMVRENRIVTAVRDSAGQIKVIVWDIGDNGSEITRRGSATGGNISKVAVCGVGLNTVATTVINSENEMKVILWRIEENGEVTRLKDAKLNGQVKGVAAALVTRNYMATVSWLSTVNTLRVDVWRVMADGSLSHRQTGSAGIITALGSVCSVGAESFVTYVRDSENELRPILWNYNDNDDSLTRLDSVSNNAEIGKSAGCSLARETTVAAFRDKNEKLKLLAYRSPEDGKFIEQRGEASAGGISDVEICRLGTQMVATAVGTSSGLKVILWQVTKTGDHIVRLEDATADENFSRLAIVPTSRGQFATAIRDGAGNLKIIVWKLMGTISGGISQNFDLDVFKQLFDKAASIESVDRFSAKIRRAVGADCDNPDSKD